MEPILYFFNPKALLDYYGHVSVKEGEREGIAELYLLFFPKADFPAANNIDETQLARVLASVRAVTCQGRCWEVKDQVCWSFSEPGNPKSRLAVVYRTARQEGGKTWHGARKVQACQVALLTSSVQSWEVQEGGLFFSGLDGLLKFFRPIQVKESFGSQESRPRRLKMVFQAVNANSVEFTTVSESAVDTALSNVRIIRIRNTSWGVEKLNWWREDEKLIVLFAITSAPSGSIYWQKPRQIDGPHEVMFQVSDQESGQMRSITT